MGALTSFVFLFWYLFSQRKLWPVDCGLSMWGKIMIPIYRLWLHGLYGPCCPLSPEGVKFNHSLTHFSSVWGKDHCGGNHRSLIYCSHNDPVRQSFRIICCKPKQAVEQPVMLLASWDAKARCSCDITVMEPGVSKSNLLWLFEIYFIFMR